LQKGWILCQEETVQGLPAKGQAQDVVWDEARARVEAEWEDHSQQGQAEIVSAQAAELKSLMLPDSLVIKKYVLSVVRK